MNDEIKTTTTMHTIDALTYHCCPKCGESYYMEMESTRTCVYYPPIYKNGVNVNPDRNKTTMRCKCMNCGEEFTVTL